MPPEIPPLEQSSILPSASPYIDPFLGFSTALWPWLRRLCAALDLCVQFREAREVDPSSSLAIALHVQCVEAVRSTYEGLASWTPPDTYVCDQAESSGSQAVSSPLTKSCTHIALAYRHCALALLHQAAESHPNDVVEAQGHIKLALTHCEATFASGGPVNGILWPLFTSACEATTHLDKATVRCLFAELGARRGMINTERAWAAVVCVWNASARNSFRESVAKRGVHACRIELIRDAGLSTILA